MSPTSATLATNVTSLLFRGGNTAPAYTSQTYLSSGVLFIWLVECNIDSVAKLACSRHNKHAEVHAVEARHGSIRVTSAAYSAFAGDAIRAYERAAHIDMQVSKEIRNRIARRHHSRVLFRLSKILNIPFQVFSKAHNTRNIPTSVKH